MKPISIFFTQDEARAVALGLGCLIEDIASMNEMPLNPQSRKMQRDITLAVKSAAAKIEKYTGIKCELPPYNPGDENEFFTKQS